MYKFVIRSWLKGAYMKKAKAKKRKKELTRTQQKKKIQELEKRLEKLRADTLKLLVQLRSIRTTH